MRYMFAIPLAIGALTMAPTPTRGLGTDVRAGKSSTASASKARTLPSWARKYNMNCSGCHYPTVPRLNATGLSFKWAGYRMPSEIGKNAEVKKIEEYLAARVVVQYDYTKTEKQPADANSLGLPSASLFAAGAIGTNYGAFMEFEREPEGTIDLIGQIGGVWGRENAFGGVRVGQGHMIIGGAVAGFDRPTGIVAPLALSVSTTRGVPLRLSGDQAGAEAFYVFGGINRTSVQFLNGLASAERTAAQGSVTSKDWVVTNQLVLDDYGVNVGAIAYFGTIKGIEAAEADLTSRYYRLGLTANKFVGPFEAQAGYVYSGDSRLPTGGTSPFASSSLSGNGYWLYGGYTVKPTFWTVYGRYDSLDPNRNGPDDALRRVVIGSVLPVNVPEYLRLGVEYVLDTPQGVGALRQHAARLQVHVAF